MRIGRAKPKTTEGPQRRLDEYPFYPFVVDATGHVRMNLWTSSRGWVPVLKTW